MDAKYVSILKDLGLSDNEVDVYLTLLKLGESSVHFIAKSSEIARTTVYHLLDSLLEKGFVSYVIKEKIKYYTSMSPKLIVSRLEAKKKQLQSIVPDLMALEGKISKKPSVELYEGIKGIRTVLDLVLDASKPISHLGELSLLQEILKFVFPHFMRTRVERKIPIRVLGKKEKGHDLLKKNSKKEFRELVFIPEKFNFSSNIFIFSDKVAVLNLKQEPYYAFLISDKEYFESQKNMFDLIWSAYK